MQIDREPAGERRLTTRSSDNPAASINPAQAKRHQLTRLLIPGLIQLFAAASVNEMGSVAEPPPDNKGQVWERNPFVSKVEGATEAWYGPFRPRGRQIIVEAHLHGVSDKRSNRDRCRAYAGRTA